MDSTEQLFAHLYFAVITDTMLLTFFQDQVKMNQLQSLIHDALIGTGHVSQCAILKRKDGNLKASSVGFQVQWLRKPALDI